jgi:hypothetical protein
MGEKLERLGVMSPSTSRSQVPSQSRRVTLTEYIINRRLLKSGWKPCCAGFTELNVVSLGIVK